MDAENSWIEIVGRGHDLVGLRRLFEKAGLGVMVETSVGSQESGILVMADDDGLTSARLVGPMVDQWLLPVDSPRFAAILLNPRIKALNGHCRLLDPNFGGVRAVAVGVFDGISLAKFVLPDQQKLRTGSTLGWHQTHAASLADRMVLVEADDLCALVVETLSEPPSWTSIYACFETIKHDHSVGDLVQAKLITKQQLKAFGAAANNITARAEGARHGHTKKNQKLSAHQQLELMTLSEAEELHRQVVTRYLDRKTGHTTGFEVCDWMNDAPRFGISPFQREL
ncbi:hypothetical protein [Maricaulis alexandrii]|uniref:hypothetical protein n=1 Tax=Maricaulis alexandrii TaxID=2570354 RepID=UPI001108B26A|nr:hypothetical protein [Maricaulis alexandrii]